MNAAIEIVAAVSFVYFILALGQLTGERQSTAIKYIALAVVAAWVLIDWLSGATGWALVEGVVLIVAIPFGVAHLTILMIHESRQG